jgi:hypothetical protein
MGWVCRQPRADGHGAGVRSGNPWNTGAISIADFTTLRPRSTSAAAS